MRVLNGLILASLLAAGGLAQTRGFTSQPFVTGGFGNVVFPAGTPITPPGVSPFPNVVFPSPGTGPQLVLPTNRFVAAGGANRGFNGGFVGGQWRGRRTGILPYAVPVYIPGYGYDYYGYDAGYGYGSGYGYPYGPVPPAPQPPNVIVPYPSAQPPVVVGGDNSRAATPPPAQPQAAAPDESAEPTHYLIALKDHTIFSAVAYWVEGDTLHYFTTPSTHNQVSLSLVDRDLTDRLNREAGVTLNLPKN
jgi:hypothetical protein